MASLWNHNSIITCRDVCVIFGASSDDDRGHDLVLEGDSNSDWKVTGCWPSSCCTGNNESFIHPQPQPALAGWNYMSIAEDHEPDYISNFMTDEVEIFKLINLKRKL